MDKDLTIALRVIITGSTGMVGKGVLYECLEHPMVESVLVINRHAVGIDHPKLKEIIHGDFLNLQPIQHHLTGYNTCFFCLGVSAFRMPEKEYYRLTHDITMHVARTFLQMNPSSVFCYVSGQGTDSSGKGPIMWARIKGITENELLGMPFRKSFMFRPGYIQPTRGIKSRTRVYNMVYRVLKPLYPLMKRIVPNALTTNTDIGKAMIKVALSGYRKQRLTPADINIIASL